MEAPVWEVPYWVQIEAPAKADITCCMHLDLRLMDRVQLEFKGYHPKESDRAGERKVHSILFRYKNAEQMGFIDTPAQSLYDKWMHYINSTIGGFKAADPEAVPSFIQAVGLNFDPQKS